AQNGTVALDADGDPLFTAAQGYTGPASFTYTVQNQNGATDQATVTLQVRSNGPFVTTSFADRDRAVVADLGARESADAARILLLGDSITHGFNVLAGWRAPLWESITQEEGLWVDFVGGRTDNAALTFHDPDHQGVPGILTDTVADQITGIAADNPSDIALILLGANNAINNKVSTFAESMMQILTTLHAANPNGMFLVSDLSPMLRADRDARIDEINAELPSVIADAQALGINAVLLSGAGSSLTVGDLNDGVHPDEGGHDKFAEAWLAGLGANATIDGGTYQGTPEAIASDIDGLIGSDFGDRLSGDAGANQIIGGAGDDWIEGRGGYDVLWGEAGRDQFVFSAQDDDDVIMDFNAAEDIVYLRSAAGASMSTSQSGADAIVAFGDTTVTLYNTDEDDITFEFIEDALV
ncbi:MAG: GDSL-type esterase/lipase family protein, partial [Pseudomonadota bacterium]